MGVLVGVSVGVSVGAIVGVGVVVFVGAEVAVGELVDVVVGVGVAVAGGLGGAQCVYESTPRYSELMPPGPPFVTKYRNARRTGMVPVIAPSVRVKGCQTIGYAFFLSPGSMLRSKLVTTPTEFDVLPTFRESPNRLRRTSIRSG